MLSITEIKTHISTAIEQFLENFPNAVVPKIVVCPSSRRQAVRNKVLAECGASKEDEYGTSAEVISGPLGTQILVFQSMVKSASQVNHAVWHELGHIMFGDDKAFNVDLNLDTPLRSGYAVVNEFMAEYIALYVNGNEGFGNVYNPNMYLQMTFENGDVTPYWLSFYLAIMVGDTTVPEQRMDEAEEALPPKVWHWIKVIMTLLFDQTDQEEFWKADKEFLEQVGEAYDNLYHVVFWGG